MIMQSNEWSFEHFVHWGSSTLTLSEILGLLGLFLRSQSASHTWKQNEVQTGYQDMDLHSCHRVEVLMDRQQRIREHGCLLKNWNIKVWSAACLLNKVVQIAEQIGLFKGAIEYMLSSTYWLWLADGQRHQPADVGVKEVGIGVGGREENIEREKKWNSRKKCRKSREKY